LFGLSSNSEYFPYLYIRGVLTKKKQRNHKPRIKFGIIAHASKLYNNNRALSELSTTPIKIKSLKPEWTYHLAYTLLTI